MGIAMILFMYAGYQVLARLDAANAYAESQTLALAETWLAESSRHSHGHKATKAEHAPQPGPEPAEEAAPKPEAAQCVYEV